MADWYWFNNAADNKWTSANWNAQGDGLGAWGTPAEGDSAYVADAYSADDITVDGATAALALLDVTEYTGAITVTNAITTAEFTVAISDTATFAGAANINAASPFAVITPAAVWAGYTGTMVVNGGAGD